MRLDYLAPSISLFDLANLLFLFTLPPTVLKTIFSRLQPLILFLFLSLIPFTTPLPVFYVFRFLLFTFVVLASVNLYSSKLAPALFLTLVFQVILGTFQFFTNQAGWFYFLGERHLSLSSLRVAKVGLLGQLHLRAYGTFSHPNTLAGWLVLTTILINQFSSSRRLRFFSLIFTFWGLILTQSRLVLFVFLIWLIYQITDHRSQITVFLLTSYFLLLTFFPRPLALLLRLSLIKASFQIFSHHPLFGAGFNASLPLYAHLNPFPPLLQPDHNSFTLLLSQTGLFGLLTFVLAVKHYRHLLTSHLPAQAGLLLLTILMFFDHYLFTSSQGLFIITLFIYALNFNQTRPSHQH